VHHEESFAAGHKIQCQVLALRGAQGFVGRGYDPLAVWQQYATDVGGQALLTGHFLPRKHRTWSAPPCANFLS
jgi:haloacetate dehalogenase